MNHALAGSVVLLASSMLFAGATDPAARPSPTSASTLSPADIPKAKQTSLGLYLTAREAYEKWKADPAGVKILDVRTPEEYLFVGHAPAAWNVPLMLQTYTWDPSGRNLVMTPNPEFLDRAKALFKPSDTLVVICRSGGRSARAADRLAQAGFTQVYSVVDGMEGDPIDDPASPHAGPFLKGGWKNSDLPWTYALDPAKMSLPGARGEAAAAKP